MGMVLSLTIIVMLQMDFIESTRIVENVPARNSVRERRGERMSIFGAELPEDVKYNVPLEMLELEQKIKSLERQLSEANKEITIRDAQLAKVLKELSEEKDLLERASWYIDCDCPEDNHVASCYVPKLCKEVEEVLDGR